MSILAMQNVRTVVQRSYLSHPNKRGRYNAVISYLQETKNKHQNGFSTPRPHKRS